VAQQRISDISDQVHITKNENYTESVFSTTKVKGGLAVTELKPLFSAVLVMVKAKESRNRPGVA